MGIGTIVKVKDSVDLYDCAGVPIPGREAVIIELPLLNSIEIVMIDNNACAKVQRDDVIIVSRGT